MKNSISASSNHTSSVQNHTLNTNQNQKGGKSKKTPVETLIYQIVTTQCNLFYDRNKKIYCEVQLTNQDGTIYKNLLQVNSEDFKNWLTHQCFSIHFITPSDPQLKSASRLIKHEALTAGQEIEPYLRVASLNGSIEVDLGTQDRKVVRITKAGWTITAPTVLFQRYPHTDELPVPVQGRNIKELLEYFPPLDEHQQCLVLCWLIASFMEHIERPFLLIEGPPGSGKTTLGVLLKSFIDPMKGAALSYNDNENEVAQIIDHQYLPLLDNVTQITRKISDLSCRTFSGGSHIKKELYTNDKDFILKLSGNIIFTAINLRKPKADFLDRCHKIELDKTEYSNRSREELTRKLEEAKSRIFGGILSTVAATLNQVGNVKPNGKYRTVDFDRYATAAAVVMGYGADFFNEARDYCEELKKERLTNSTPLLEAIDGYLRAKNGYYSGNLKKLLQQLPNYTGHPEELPKQPNMLSRRLRESNAELTAAGIIYRKAPYNNHNGTQWEFRLKSYNCADTSAIECSVQSEIQEETPNSVMNLQAAPEVQPKESPEESHGEDLPDEENPFLSDHVDQITVTPSDTPAGKAFKDMTLEEQNDVLKKIGLG